MSHLPATARPLDVLVRVAKSLGSYTLTPEERTRLRNAAYIASLVTTTDATTWGRI